MSTTTSTETFVEQIIATASNAGGAAANYRRLSNFNRILELAAESSDDFVEQLKLTQAKQPPERVNIERCRSLRCAALSGSFKIVAG